MFLSSSAGPGLAREALLMGYLLWDHGQAEAAPAAFEQP
jgi:hypothetical protein